MWRTKWMKMTNRTRRMTKTRRTKQMRTIITQRLLFSGHTVSPAGCNMTAAGKTANDDKDEE